MIPFTPGGFPFYAPYGLPPDGPDDPEDAAEGAKEGLLPRNINGKIVMGEGQPTGDSDKKTTRIKTVVNKVRFIM